MLFTNLLIKFSYLPPKFPKICPKAKIMHKYPQTLLTYLNPEILILNSWILLFLDTIIPGNHNTRILLFLDTIIPGYYYS